MAINPETQYPGKITPSSARYPYGEARNITIPGDGTGTPWEAALVNDLFGFQQALLSAGAVVPSGTPDEVGDSQYMVALGKIKKTQVADTVAMTADVNAAAGMVYQTAEYVVGGGEEGGGTYDVIAGTGTVNGLDRKAHDTKSLTFVLRVRGVIRAKAFGVRADDSTDDLAAWQRVLAYYKTTGFPIKGHSNGVSVVSDTVEYSTVGDGADALGLAIYGAGRKRSRFKNIKAAGGPTWRLTSGASPADFQRNGRFTGFGFIDDGAGANSHAIEYRGCWDQHFRDLEFNDINGAGIRAVNSAGDNDSSNNVAMRDIYAYDCAGAGFDSSNSTGGLSNHSLERYQFENCNGNNGNLILDGVIHFTENHHTIVGNPSGPRYTSAQKGIVLKGTSITPSDIHLGCGEMGNSLAVCWSIEKTQTTVIHPSRVVKRAGENTLTTILDIADGVLTTKQLTVMPLQISLDDAAPVTTLFKIGTGADSSTRIFGPLLNSFASGNVYASFNAGAENNGVYLENDLSQTLFSKPRARLRTTVSAIGTTQTPDLLTGNWQQYLFDGSAGGAQTINPPANGASDGASFILELFNSGAVGLAVTFAAGIDAGNYSDPVSPQRARSEYVYDSTSATWLSMGWVVS